MRYAEDLTNWQVKTIGVLEFLGAVGLIIPKLIDVAPVVSPIAAAALAVTMIGAIGLHVRRHEAYIVPVILGLLARALAVLGFLTA